MGYPSLRAGGCFAVVVQEGWYLKNLKFFGFSTNTLDLWETLLYNNIGNNDIVSSQEILFSGEYSLIRRYSFVFWRLNIGLEKECSLNGSTLFFVEVSLLLCGDMMGVCSPGRGNMEVIAAPPIS